MTKLRRFRQGSVKHSQIRARFTAFDIGKNLDHVARFEPHLLSADKREIKFIGKYVHCPYLNTTSLERLVPNVLNHKGKLILDECYLISKRVFNRTKSVVLLRRIPPNFAELEKSCVFYQHSDTKASVYGCWTIKDVIRFTEYSDNNFGIEYRKPLGGYYT